MKKGLIFLIALLVLLSATAITFARNTTTTTVAITAGGIGASGFASTDLTGISTIPDDIALPNSSGLGRTHVLAPAWSPVVEQPGSITKGDLYYLNTKTYTGDIYVTVYMTNSDALRRDYNYLNLKVMVYSNPDKPVLSTDWSDAVTVDGTEIPVYLSLINGSVSFYLAGDAYYTISVDGGDYYCIDTDAAGLTPEFYIEVAPL